MHRAQGSLLNEKLFMVLFCLSSPAEPLNWGGSHSQHMDSQNCDYLSQFSIYNVGYL